VVIIIVFILKNLLSWGANFAILVRSAFRWGLFVLGFVVCAVFSRWVSIKRWRHQSSGDPTQTKAANKGSWVSQSRSWWRVSCLRNFD